MSINIEITLQNVDEQTFTNRNKSNELRLILTIQSLRELQAGKHIKKDRNKQINQI